MTDPFLDNYRLPRPAPSRVLACGAWLKNRACLIDADRVWWSAQHGDLDQAEHCVALERSVDALLARLSGPLQAVAHDLHPDFHSTRLALSTADDHGVPALAVQHHHAHVAAVLAEHGSNEPVIGLALDGFGLGDDGQAWGGELLLLGDGPGTKMRRLDHLSTLALPGADMAARQPWRMAAAVLQLRGRGADIVPRFAPAVGVQAAQGVAMLLQHDLQCPRSSSAGRWFDAAAGALGLCTHQHVEAEAAILLESLARTHLAHEPGFDQPWTSLDLGPLVEQLFALGDEGEAARARGAAMFHLALANALAQQAGQHAARHGISTVVLGGGCFANRVLTQALSSALLAKGLRVLLPQRAGCGDAGLALGQAWVAAHALHVGAAAPSDSRHPAVASVL